MFQFPILHFQTEMFSFIKEIFNVQISILSILQQKMVSKTISLTLKFANNFINLLSENSMRAIKN